MVAAVEYLPVNRIRKTIFLAIVVVQVLIMQAPAAAEFDRHTIEDCRLLIEWRGDFSTAQKEQMLDWLTTVMATTTLLHGQSPRREIRVVLQPYPSKSAVPFARVLREDPQGILFYVNPDRPLQEFVSDWTAYHELSHLFIPYPGNADIWFSEGLASYYQNVLQKRAGLLTHDAAVEKLRSGFERGLNDDRHEQLTLAELSPVMRDRGAFMRVYWSGALYFLMADVALRGLPADEQQPRTLDAVLREFGQCCLQDSRRWTGLEIATEFDRIAGTALFVPLYRQFEQTYALPDYAELLAASELDDILAGPGQITGLTVQ
jgi:hypothetical protein